MNRQAAKRLIEETLSQPFDEGRFKYFVKNLLNDLDESKAGTYSEKYIKDAFKQHIRLYKRIGKYTDPDGVEIDVLIVYLRRAGALDAARTIQRDFIRDYLKTRGNKEAGLVAFVGPEPSDWRFSLVRIDYRSEQTPSGKVKVKEELTPVRRFSFLVGKNEPNHTAQQQLYPLLEDSRHNPTLSQLEAAFNIESVTKEFFEKYKELFLDLKEELDAILAKNRSVEAEFKRCEIDTPGFAKRLLGQIVFLYFLQKKGWLGVQPGKEWGTGSKNYLFELYQKQHVGYSNFFNDLLEPLFYEALAVERKDNFYPRLNCKIPFLNGGLFEPSGGYDWKNVHIPISNKTFGKIFETFTLYNFTVREDEPLEREVTVDPEMLGKVFENLLEVKDRKSIGAFYTPREIVHYMCQESLINYLDTSLNRQEQKLAQEEPQQGQLFGPAKPVQKALSYKRYIPVVPREDIEWFIRHGEAAVAFDAAKEAGTKSYAWQMPDSIRTHASEIDRALAEIKICDPAIGSGAFPVGMMTEIVKAREILSTYLPADLERTPYAFKRHAIEHSLYGVDIDASAIDIARLRLWLSLVVDEDDFHIIKPLPNLDYKIVCGNSLQSVKQGFMEGEIEAKKEQFQNTTDPKEKERLRAEIDRILGILTQNFSKFDFRIYFSEVFRKRGGFDVVIANPPYVRGERIKDQKKDLKQQFSCYTGTADLYVYFYERGIEILRPNGTLAFISSNKYFRSGYGEKLRAFLTQHTIHQLIDFGDAPVFDAIAYPSIIILKKKPSQENQVRAMTWKPGPPIQQFADIYRSESFLMEQAELKSDGWRLESPQVLRLLEKLTRAGKPLGEYVDGKIYYGIKTGLNEAFIVDQPTRDRLIAEHASSSYLLKPILRGRDVKRWRIDYSGRYLIKIESSENKQHPWSGMEMKKAEQKFEQCYPAVYQHLLPYRERLIKRDDQGKYYWELRSCKYWDDFNYEQIVWGNLATQPKFAFAPSGYILSAPANTVISNSHYLAGILNSSVTHYLVIQSAAERQGGFVEFKPMYISPLAIPPKPSGEKISALVREILALVRDNKNPNQLEQQLNHEVYRLYGLTDAEIQIIEDAIQSEGDQ